MKEKRLNFGCGDFRKEGFINLDGNPAVQSDVLHDLDVFPYPFPNNTFELIEGDHVLEQ
ncbi:MAG: methyltransferase type 11 [Parcubacteria group bacterium Gr01-1014_72]|nr:MAG: methyltransferase type 11 [Parcubacteria group bacterium Gr01-1014_72]